MDLDDLIEIGSQILESTGKVVSNLTEKAVDIAKEEAPHIIHKASEVIEEIIKHK